MKKGEQLFYPLVLTHLPEIIPLISENNSSTFGDKFRSKDADILDDRLYIFSVKHTKENPQLFRKLHI